MNFERVHIMKKPISIAALLAVVIPMTTACANSGSPSSSQGQETNEPTVIRFGARQDYNGISYIDDSGNLAGYDIEVMKVIDEKLENYVFEYDAVGQEALLTGLETKQYVGAIGGFFWSQKRADAYLFPQNNIGASLACLQVRKEDVGKLVTLEDLYERGGKLVPISPISGTYGVVVDYNNANPDKQIELGTIEWNSVGTEQISQWIHDGVYDANVSLVNGWDLALEQGVNTFDTGIDRDQPFTYIKSYTLFAKGQEAFVKEYDSALKALLDDGTISEIYKRYNGFDFLTLQQS